jgi:hypothetical protein
VSQAAAAAAPGAGGRWRFKRILVGALVIIVIGTAAELLGSST